MPLSPSSSAQSARETIAKRLRDLRQDAGLSGHDLALRTGFSESKVSRIAHAKTPPSADDIHRWCAACGAEDQAADLIAASRAADEMYVQWKRLHRTGMKHAQDAILPLFENSRQIRMYCSNVMPGIVQRRDYARALMSTITAFQDTPNDVEDAVDSRLQRGRYLYQGNRTFAFVLEEAVLRYPLGDAEAMLDQLRHLLDVMVLPRVSLGVIPFNAPRTMWPLEAFYMFDDRQVDAELLTAVLKITTPGEIAAYSKAFKILSSMAVHGPQARALIEQAIASLG
ncbi:helix-turn-helix transcriptional regulator [Kitasatospora aureofaciens]|uniref:helix-turn-helix domain-containing protein n=1 Tax=Kitasatospora aureofaciens TaxID=1894 RepID=UPI001C490839|nr:helix-turn-helix transcriptional regulator [Kitasatospora aureofaciens]MBV6697342.1 helix-turn-helix transcriptional regulator [Kitasatospora aureofaciens]